MTLPSKKIMYPIAYVIFPVVNLLVAQYTNVFTENYSFVGNGLQHSLLLYIWGSLCGIYFFIATKAIMDKIKYKMKYGLPLLGISCIGMIFSVYIPYLPDLYPLIGELHIYVSIFATILYVLLFFHILLEFAYKNYEIYKRYYSLYGMLVGFCLLTMVLYGGVNTIMEFTFSCGQAILLAHLIATLEKEVLLCE